MGPTRAELAARQQIQQTGLDAHARATMGMPMKILKAHLQVADRLLQGDTSILSSPKLRNWLYAQAEASGKTRQEVDAVLREVKAAPTGEARVQRYAVALSGDPQAAHRGLALAQSYQKENVAGTVSGRLQAQDQQMRRSGSTFELPDEGGRMAQAREESGSLRRALETAAVSSGLSADRPQSLQDYQARAAAYAEMTASKLEGLERRRAAGDRVDLREDIEAAWMTDRALRAKTDVGLPGGDSLGTVVERADAARSAGEAIAEQVENQ
jgi:hypothetical protein